MGFDSAASRAQRMLHMQHFVEEHVFNGVAGHAGPVQPPVHDDLVECRIEAAELRAPGPAAPAEPGAMQTSAEVVPVEASKHGRQIVNLSAGAEFDTAAPKAAEWCEAPQKCRPKTQLPVGANEFAS